MGQRQIVILGAAVALVAAALLAYFVVFPASSEVRAESWTGGKGDVQIFPTDRTLGSPNAPIVVIEYAAPICPHCARFNAQVFPRLKATYIDSGKVYYVFRVFPISAADGAAEAIARCLPADNYFAFIDLLFRNQKQWDPEYGVTDVHGALVKLGGVAGLSAEQVDHCIADKTSADRINQVAEDGVTKYGIRATPTLVINGTVQPAGFVPWPTLQNTLEKLLSTK